MQSRIGRFNIIRVLGEGNQGVVHLARDPLLERKVAIKTLRTSQTTQTHDLSQMLLDEARVISKMTHPNIVSIFEAGEESGQTYLVFEYVQGKTLDEVIPSRQYQKLSDALKLFKPICMGVQHSHKHQIIHGDLKPANIILDNEGTPKIMDFGIARLLSSDVGGGAMSDKLYGTPRYMPPEYLQHRQISTANDVYALGLILYEIVTGEAAVKGKTLKQILHHIMHEKMVLPSRLNPDINDVFEDIILKASDKKVENRFRSVDELLRAIDAYENNAQATATVSAPGQDAAITFMMRKIKRQQDFPALSESLVKINSLVSRDDTHAQELANVIATDFALTNKILKLVNSAYYRGSKPEIKTISQAVLMLGFDEIRSIAMSLMLIDHLHNKTKAKRLKDHIVSSIYSGILNKDLAAAIDLPNTEEAFLTGTFYQLGELLTLYYFYEDAEEIEDLVRNQGISREDASRQVLGVSYEKLGEAIAREWKLPQYIIQNMKPYQVQQKSRKTKLSPEEKLNAITTLANELADTLEDEDNTAWRKDAVRVWKHYSKDLGLADDLLIRLADQARNNLIDVNHIFKIDLHNSEVMKKVERMANPQLEETVIDKTVVIETSSVTPPRRSAREILLACKNNILAEMANKNDLKNILNTFMHDVHEAFDLERVIISLYNRQQQEMQAYLGVGITESFLKQFRFKVGGKNKDVFSVACHKGVDIFINDTEVFERKTRLPPWYRQIIDAETFMLFPMQLNNKPVGMIYLDKNKKSELVIEQENLKLLQQLRIVICQAIQKRTAA